MVRRASEIAFILFLALSLNGCGDDTPDIRNFSAYVQKMANEECAARCEFVSVTKADGQSQEVMGAKAYTMQAIVTIRILQDLSYVSLGVMSGFITIEAPGFFGWPTAHAGDTLNLLVRLNFQKFESGWKINQIQLGHENNGAEPPCAAATVVARRMTPLARGEVAAVSVAGAPSRLPALTFRDARGVERHLADWKGRVVLLNLWATWCVPCRKELPSLAALEQKLGGADFEVVAVNIDTGDPDKPKAWLKSVGVSGLTYYADAGARVFQELKQNGKAIGMPTSLLVDGAGCEIASLAGPGEWGSADAVALVQAALRK